MHLVYIHGFSVRCLSITLPKFLAGGVELEVALTAVLGYEDSLHSQKALKNERLSQGR